METRAAKRKANSATLVQNQSLKKKRVVLGELPNLPYLIVPPTLNQQKSLSLLDFKLEKSVDIDAKSGNHAKLGDPQFSEPFVSDIYEYLRTMEMEKKKKTNG